MLHPFQMIHTANALWYGTQIITSGAQSFAYSPDGEYIIYPNYDDGRKLYKKNAHDNSNGVAINSYTSEVPTYSPDGQYIVYVNNNDGDKLYRKNANDNSNGTVITSEKSLFPKYSPDGNYIIYTHIEDWQKLYKKSAHDSSNGTPITSDKTSWWSYSPDWAHIIYINKSNSSHIYKKSAHDNSNGSRINSKSSMNVSYSPDGLTILYEDWPGGYQAWEKNADDIQNGTRLLDTYSKFPQYSPNGKHITYKTQQHKLFQIQLPSAPELSAVTSTQNDINLENQQNIDFQIEGINDPDNGNTLSYFYSFDNTTYTQLPTTQTSPIENWNYPFSLDLSNREDGTLTLYIKANDGSSDSNIVQITLEKNTALDIPTQPTNFISTSIDSSSISYEWVDNASDTNTELKYILKDETWSIIVDNLAENTQSIKETGLEPGTNYSRQICAVNDTGESCSTLTPFKTKIEIEQGKVTSFQFHEISIHITEKTNIFEILLNIGQYKITFSIEKSE